MKVKYEISIVTKF